ncbi:hypothetical protein Bca4012_005183 [Brassica carinata]
MKVRQEERLALVKMEEEEARSNCKFEQDPLSAEKVENELLILIGGSRKARDRSLLKKFGLVLKTDHIDDDRLYDLEEASMDITLTPVDIALHSMVLSNGFLYPTYFLVILNHLHIRGIDKHLFIDHSVAVPFTSAQLVDLSQVEDPKLGSPSTYKDQRVLAMTTATSLGRDPLFLSSSSSSNSDRAAAIKIRFADIIVKSSSNKSEAMMTIRREKELLQRRQLEEKAMIEARMKVRQEERLAIMKMEEEEEARSNCKFEQDPLSAKKTEKELVKLIGGSRKARDRSLLKKFGLVLKTDHIDDDLLYDLEEGEIF